MICRSALLPSTNQWQLLQIRASTVAIGTLRRCFYRAALLAPRNCSTSSVGLDVSKRARAESTDGGGRKIHEHSCSIRTGFGREMLDWLLLVIV